MMIKQWISFLACFFFFLQAPLGFSSENLPHEEFNSSLDSTGIILFKSKHLTRQPFLRSSQDPITASLSSHLDPSLFFDHDDSMGASSQLNKVTSSGNYTFSPGILSSNDKKEPPTIPSLTLFCPDTAKKRRPIISSELFIKKEFSSSLSQSHWASSLQESDSLALSPHSTTLLSFLVPPKNNTKAQRQGLPPQHVYLFLHQQGGFLNLWIKNIRPNKVIKKPFFLPTVASPPRLLTLPPLPKRPIKAQELFPFFVRQLKNLPDKETQKKEVFFLNFLRNTPLLEAVVQAIPSIIQSDQAGLNIFLHAAMFGYIDILTWGLKKCPQWINAANKLGETALFLACLASHTRKEACIDWLLRQKKSLVQVMTKKEESILHAAAFGGNLSIYKKLEKALSNCSEIMNKWRLNIFIIACMGGNMELVTYLYQKDQALPFLMHPTCISPLHMAALSNQQNVILWYTTTLAKQLFENNKQVTDLMKKNKASKYVFEKCMPTSHPFCGCRNNWHCDHFRSENTIKESMLNQKDQSGNTPFLYSCSSRQSSLIRWFITQYPKCIDQRNLRKENALHKLAAGGDDTSMVKEVLSLRPTFLLAKDIDGLTPFMVACWKGHSKMAVMLYHLNPKVTQGRIYFNGYSAFHLALSQGFWELAFWVLWRDPATRWIGKSKKVQTKKTKKESLGAFSDTNFAIDRLFKASNCPKKVKCTVKPLFANKKSHENHFSGQYQKDLLACSLLVNKVKQKSKNTHLSLKDIDLYIIVKKEAILITRTNPLFKCSFKAWRNFYPSMLFYFKVRSAPKA